MVRVVGVDPGTKTIDICLLEDGIVKDELSIDSYEAALNPNIIVKHILKLNPIDLVVGPSGYGVEITYIDEIPDDIFEDWYYTYILLARKEEILEGVSRGDVGSFIYYAMVGMVREFKKMKLPVVFIPGIINLPTVPTYRKFNKVDLGTADKLAVTALAVYKTAEKHNIPLDEVNFILAEMGFGYNAVIGVKEGVVVDAFGGTTMLGPGFLTMSYADLEVAQLIKEWVKTDVFTGGVSYIAKVKTFEELIKCLNVNEICYQAWNSFIEGIVKAAHALIPSTGLPKYFLTSGRLSKIKEVIDELNLRLQRSPIFRHVVLEPVGNLRGAKKSKETAQGYALIGDGLVGGAYKEVVNHLKIKEARGTSLDYIRHPKFESFKEKLPKFK
ncbi:MAG: hypothetical protein B7O98_00615 [Zestosphaera tikiterensis]|uniref:DUF1464 domain-containing protein n=1 Tax=Zestosphaera tikiterensis TaxID=1973259 RepID=A0A2R7Y8V3_9CREN|nr:MAG: hypothetical protein B7O98_00615 [Zestosphaera tikiterensis]